MRHSASMSYYLEELLRESQLRSPCFHIINAMMSGKLAAIAQTTPWNAFSWKASRSFTEISPHFSPNGPINNKSSLFLVIICQPIA